MILVEIHINSLMKKGSEIMKLISIKKQLDRKYKKEKNQQHKSNNNKDDKDKNIFSTADMSNVVSFSNTETEHNDTGKKGAKKADTIFELIKEKYRENKNLFYITIAVIMIVCYAFFFLSPYIFSPAKDSLLNTPLNNYEVLGNIQVSIDSWKYCEDSSLMEIDINVNNELTEGITFECETKSREAGNTITEIPSKIVYSSSSYLVIFVEEIPENFNEILLSLYYSTQQEESDSVSLYTNRYTAQRVNSIKIKSATEYQIERLNANIDDIQKKIESCEKTIKKYEKNNNNILSEITRLRDEEQYLTTTEIANNEEKITNYQSTISSNNNNIAKEQQKKKQYETSLDEIKLKIKDLKESEI